MKRIVFCLLTLLSLCACKRKEPQNNSGPEQMELIASVQFTEVALMVTDDSGWDITDEVIGNRRISITGREQKFLPLSRRKDNLWEIKAELPLVEPNTEIIRNGKYYVSTLNISSEKNTISVRCVYLYSQKESQVPLYGGSAIRLVRVETEDGEVLSERNGERPPLVKVYFKGSKIFFNKKQ